MVTRRKHERNAPVVVERLSSILAARGSDEAPYLERIFVTRSFGSTVLVAWCGKGRDRDRSKITSGDVSTRYVMTNLPLRLD